MRCLHWLASWLKGCSLRSRLLWLLAAIMLLTHGASSLWVWHESREQLVELIELAKNPQHSPRKLQRAQREIVVALLLSPLLLGGIGLIGAYLAISWLTRPFKRLILSLQQRSSANLEPVSIDSEDKELQQVVQAINALLSRLDLALQRERQFSADVAHELKTPIAGIRLNLELLQQKGLGDVGPLLIRLDGLHQTITQLRDLARLERGFVIGVEGRLEFERDVLAPLEVELRQMLASRRQVLICDIAQLVMKGERALLQLLLRNLIENSSRYADANSQVLVSLCQINTQKGCFAELLLRDQGPGVPPADLQRLTDAYVRLDQRGNGMGLGLNIVARVCALHRAELSISNALSETGQVRGLQIRILFPLA